MKNLEDQTSLNTSEHGVYDCNFVSYKISRLTESWSFHLNSTFPVNCVQKYLRGETNIGQITQTQTRELSVLSSRARGGLGDKLPRGDKCLVLPLF